MGQEVYKPTIESIKSPIEWKQFLGVNCQFIWFNTTIIDKQIQVLNELNIQWVRADIHWEWFEPTEGDFKWNLFDPVMYKIRDGGLHSIVYLVGTPKWISSWTSESGLPFFDAFPPRDNSVFANRLLMLAQRYSFVDYWEIWNEMNLNPAMWAPSYNPQVYDQLFRACATVFQQNGLSSKLAVGGIGYYGGESTKTRNMIDDLISLKTFEGYLSSYHPYTEYPEGDPTFEPSSIYAYLPTTRWLNQKLREVGKSSTVWSTEWGWSSEGDTTTRQANYTVKRLMLDTVANFDKTFLFTTSDLDARASSVRDQFYGLVNLSLEKKQIFNALKRLLTLTGPVIQPSKITNQQFQGVPTDFIAIQFYNPTENTNMIAFWSPQKLVPSFTITNVIGASSGTLYQVTPHEKLQSINIDQNSNSVSLPLSNDLQIFEWPTRKTTTTTTSTTSSSSTTGDKSTTTTPSTTSTTGSSSSTTSTTGFSSSTSTTSTTTSPSNSRSLSSLFSKLYNAITIGFTLFLYFI
eukprot:gene6257-7793_t